MGAVTPGTPVRGDRVEVAHRGRAAPADRDGHRNRPGASARGPPSRRDEIDAEIAAVEAGRLRCSNLPAYATATSSSRRPPVSCCPTSGRSRRTSGDWTALPASRSPRGTEPRATSSPSSWGAVPRSHTPTRGTASRRSTSSCSPSPVSSELTELLNRVAALDEVEPTGACAESITTGPRQPSVHSAPSDRSPSSCVDSSTTRSGWRTAGSSTWCARSRAPRSRSESPHRPRPRGRRARNRDRASVRASAVPATGSS